MCGRFTLRTPMNRLVERFLFELQDAPLPPRFNIAPSQPLAALRTLTPAGGRQLGMLRWGLVPSWAKDASIGYKLINARSETLTQKPSFREAFKCRRCLILTDGYYEWKKIGTTTKKQPYYIRMQDEQPFAFAGLWESWQTDDGSALETCTIITTDANDLTKPIHARMPVILDPKDYEPWLTSGEDATANLQLCLKPYPSDPMVLFPVSTLVNSPKNESPACIEPLDEPDDQPPQPRQLSFL